ncbi:MAG: hypothetical protein WBZ36_26360 [Candidatus Nitrosopolaris sp.]
MIQGGNAREYSVLKEAMFVLKCLSEGQRKQDIVDALESDKRRVSLWIDFAKDAVYRRFIFGKYFLSAALHQNPLTSLSIYSKPSYVLYIDEIIRKIRSWCS